MANDPHEKLRYAASVLEAHADKLPVPSHATAMAASIREHINGLTEFSGLFLALHLILKEPLSDANREHLSKRCKEAANAITSGIA